MIPFERALRLSVPLVLVAVLCGACAKKFDPKEVSAAELKVPASQNDYFIPVELMKRLRGTATELELVPLTVLLKDESGDLKNDRQAKRISTPPGGGELDLGFFLSADPQSIAKGAYRLYLELPELRDEKSDIQVWFVCNAEARTLTNGEKVGCECGAAYNLTSSLKQIHQSSAGILLALAAQRDLAAIAGTFLFSVARDGGRRGLARLTVVDKARPQAFCRKQS